MPIYICTQPFGRISKNYHFPNLPLLNLIAFNIGPPGKNPGAITGQGYELLSRGPTTLDVGTLDNLVLASRHSSSSSSSTTAPTPLATAVPSTAVMADHSGPRHPDQHPHDDSGEPANHGRCTPATATSALLGIGHQDPDLR